MKTLFDYITESINLKKIFVVIKPGFLNKTQDVLNIYKDEGWELESTRVKQLTLKEAKELYKVHKKESFYKELCEYMCSDITRGLLFCKNTNNDEFEEATKIKNMIREKYGESDMRNVVHSSDSIENMEHEASIYFYMV